MRRVPALLTAVLAMAGACSPGDAPPAGGPGNWELVWSDEFDGTTLDPAKWSAQIGDGCDQNLCGWGNEELQWYQAENASVGEGLLTITARRDSMGGRAFTSARLRTLEKGDWTYGRVEVRARLPQGQGIWPAIWMWPTENVYGTWAASGEIDIVELLGHEPARVHGTLHYGGPAPENTHSGAYFELPSGTFADGFHVFAIEWEEGEIRWYVDGSLYQRQTEWRSSGGPFPAPFDQRFHLVLNVAVGGVWPGNPDASTSFPQSMEVDYIRVYQHER